MGETEAKNEENEELRMDRVRWVGAAVSGLVAAGNMTFAILNGQIASQIKSRVQTLIDAANKSSGGDDDEEG